MSLPTHFRLAPTTPPTLAEAVARARWPRNRATAQLELHREELLRLRQSGESVGSLVGGLRAMGVEIGHETLRLWFNRELRHKPAKRRKSRARRDQGERGAALPPAREREIAAAIPPAPMVVAESPKPAPPQTSTEAAPVRQSSLIRPGETPLEALHRRLAALDAEKAAAKAAVPEQPGPRIA